MATPHVATARPSVRVRRQRSARTPKGKLATAATSELTVTSNPMSVLSMCSAARNGAAAAPTVAASALLIARTQARVTMTRLRSGPPSFGPRCRFVPRAIRPPNWRSWVALDRSTGLLPYEPARQTGRLEARMPLLLGLPKDLVDLGDLGQEVVGDRGVVGLLGVARGLGGVPEDLVQVRVSLEMGRREVVGPQHPEMMLDQVSPLLLDRHGAGLEHIVVGAVELLHAPFHRLRLDAGLGRVVYAAGQIAVGVDRTRLTQLIGEAEQVSNDRHRRGSLMVVCTALHPIHSTPVF